jgi:hypothetical protein
MMQGESLAILELLTFGAIFPNWLNKYNATHRLTVDFTVIKETSVIAWS